MVEINETHEPTEETAHTRELATIYGRNFYATQSPVALDDGFWVLTDEDDAGFEVWRFWRRRGTTFLGDPV